MSWECGGVDMIIVSLWSSTSSFAFSHVCRKFHFRLLGFLCQLPRMRKKVPRRCQRHSQKRVKQHGKTRESNFANFLCHFFCAAVAVVLTVQHFFYMLRGKKERKIVKSSSLNKQFSQWNWKKSTTTFCLLFFTSSPIGYFVPTLGKLSSHDNDELEKWKTTILPHHK